MLRLFPISGQEFFPAGRLLTAGRGIIDIQNRISKENCKMSEDRNIRELDMNEMDQVSGGAQGFYR